MLYLIGLGLNEKSLTLEGAQALKNCKRIYLESYTVDFPYNLENLEKALNLKNKIEKLGRKEVESNKLLEEAKKENIALLIYGSPLFATTHQTLIQDAKKQKVKTKIIFSSSVFDALSESGLQLYKFGKITSMPKWQKSFAPDSFLEIVKENLSIKAHSLILCDIGLSFQDALHQLETSSKNKNLKIEKLVVCSNLGTENSKFLYNKIENLKKEKISNPFCLIIPAELHFMEKEAIESL
jgi:diphthine synthase